MVAQVAASLLPVPMTSFLVLGVNKKNRLEVESDPQEFLCPLIVAFWLMYEKGSEGKRKN